MHSASLAETNATMARGHRFVVTLNARDGQPVEVRSCEVIGAFHRNRFTFPSAIRIPEVFDAEIAKGVLHCLASLSDATEVVSLPTVAIEVPGLTLARAHLIATKADDDSLNIILRFKVVIGAVTRAFRRELGIEDSVSDHSAHMSALVLTDIVMPLLDLCAAVEEGQLSSPRNVETFMDTLLERSAEVRFQAELIKRFVAQAPDGTGRPARQRTLKAGNGKGAKQKVPLLAGGATGPAR